MTDRLTIYYTNIGKAVMNSPQYDLTMRQVFDLMPDVVIFLEHPYNARTARPYVDGYRVIYSKYVAICYRTSLEAVRIPVGGDLQDFVEILCINDTLVAGVYFHPEFSPAPLTEAVRETFVSSGVKNWIIASDTNASHPSWDFCEQEPPPYKKTRGDTIYEFVTGMKGTIANTYTEYGSFTDYSQSPPKDFYLDIFALHEDVPSYGWEMFQELLAKDHRGMYMSIFTPSGPVKQRFRTHWNSFRKFLSPLSTALTKGNLTITPDELDDWYHHFLESAQKAKKTVNISPKTPIWWNDSYLTRLAHLKRLKNRHRKNKSHEGKKHAYYTFRDAFCKFSRKLRTAFFANFLAELRWADSRTLGRKINFLKTKRREFTIPTLLVGVDHTRIRASHLAQELLTFYFHTVPAHLNPPPETEQMRGYLDRNSEALRSEISPLSEVEFLSILRTLKNRSAPGPDGVTKRHLVNMDFFSRRVLLYWYNFILKEGLIPQSWKTSKAIFIPKNGKSPAQIQSWRPISLTNLMFRVFDKILASRISVILEAESILHNEQHGFRRQRGLETYYMSLFDRLDELKLAGKKIGLLSLDFSKAFDRVNVKHSLARLFASLPKSSQLIKYFPLLLDYVTDRKVLTTFSNVTAEKEVSLGIPQGGALSPHLFNLVIAVFLTELKKQDLGFEYFVYADDIVIVVQGTDYTAMEDNIGMNLPQLCSIAEKHCLYLNYDKTAYMRYVNLKKFLRTEPIVLHGGGSLTVSPSLKVLGVTIQGNSTHAHWDNILRRGWGQAQRIIQIGRVKGGLSAHFRLNLFRALCVSLFLWSTIPLCKSLSQERIDKLDLLQGRMGRAILSLRTTAPRIPTIALSFRSLLSDLLRTQFLLTVLFNPHNRKIFDNRNGTSSWHARKNTIVSGIRRNLEHFHVDSLVQYTTPLHLYSRPLPTFSLINKEILDRKAALARATLDGWKGVVGYTDGSRLTNSGKTAWAFAFYYQKNMIFSATGNAARTESIFWAECYAILQALKYCVVQGLKRCILFVDSVGAIQALCAHKTTLETIDEIWKLVDKSRIELNLYWCPAHSGNRGNEAVDDLAHSCAMRSLPPQLSFRKNTFRTLLIDRSRAALLEAWRDAFPKSILRTRRALRLYYRHHYGNSIFTQLVTNCSQLRTSLCFVTPRILPYCDCTDATALHRPEESLRHVLLKCTLWIDAQKRFFHAVGYPYYSSYSSFIRNIFQDESRIRALLSFFSTTQLLRADRMRSLIG